MKLDNWEGAFDLTPFSNGWARYGDSIQATFWELRREQVKAVRRFITAGPERPKKAEDEMIRLYDGERR